MTLGRERFHSTEPRQVKGVEAKHRMIYISHLLNNQNNSLQHNVILANKCRSGKCGIDDDQRGHLLLVLLVDVELVLGGEHFDVVPLGQGVALPFFEILNWMLLNLIFNETLYIASHC